jgi:hypothetical protein
MRRRTYNTKPTYRVRLVDWYGEPFTSFPVPDRKDRARRLAREHAASGHYATVQIETVRRGYVAASETVKWDAP